VSLFARVLLVCASLTAGAARASVSYEVLSSFQKPGTQVVAPLMQHSDGNFYGVASTNGAFRLGTVFKLTPAGALTTLHSFSGTDGSGPSAGLVEGADQALYGTTSSGGTHGFGVVFKITSGGVFTKLVDFTGSAGSAPGSVPHGLMRHGNDLFYGVTQGGGANGFGTVFQMTPGGVLTTLRDFTGSSGAAPGAEAQGPLVASGNLLYGMTKLGGATGQGVLFEVSTAGVYRSLGEFSGTAGTRAGANPSGGLMLNTDGALYGVTEYGGTNSFGVAFKITTAASPVYTVLRHFADASGSQPVGPLARGSDGQLYGATANGGVSARGTLFKITTTGTHTLLANFTGETGGALGSAPRAGPCLATDGLFYLLTSAGSTGNMGSFCKISSAGVFTAVSSLSLGAGWMPSGMPVASGSGALLFPMAAGGTAGGGNVSSVSTAGTVSPLAALGGTLGTYADGGLSAVSGSFYGVTARGGASARGTLYRYTPGTGTALVLAYTTSAGSLGEGSLTLGADGLLYGIGREGGASSRGSIYKVTTAGVRTRLISFTGTAGAAPGGRPCGPLVLAGDGNFYGMTEEGGTANVGVVFRLTPAGAYSALHHFTAVGPRSPQGGFVIGNDGQLYGTTSAGGTDDAGTLIRFLPSSGLVQVLGEFSGIGGATPGAIPMGELTVASNGSIYGMTAAGGNADEGTVWRYSTSGGLETLLSFTGQAGAAPGSAADTDGAGLILTGGLAFGSDGQLYGVSAGGGPEGGGVVFRLQFSSPLQDWKLALLGDPNAPDAGDADADGLANLLEYIFDTSPVAPQTSSAMDSGLSSYPDGDFLTVIVPRDPARSDVTIIVEASDTLAPGSWTTLATSTLGGVFTGPGYYDGDSASPGVKQVIIRDVQPVATSPRRFVRVRVTR
jgi:uncharacterized repeat protein (TIGR03803 family)